MPEAQVTLSTRWTFISGRATRGMDRFAITREGNNILVDLNHRFDQEKDRAGWDGLPV